MQIIKDQQIIDDSWQRITEIDSISELPEGNVIVPFSFWLGNKNALSDLDDRVSVCLNGADDIEALIPELSRFSMIALDFPAYTDGRCYSFARLLRDRYGFEGEIRAVGDVLRDQLLPMHRCGINAFVLRENDNIEAALAAFKEFSVTYQTAADGEPPIYHLR